MSESPFDILTPITKAVVELAQLPISLAKDIQPDMQKQLKDAPEVIRANAQYFVKSLQEIPNNLRQLSSGASIDGNDLKAKLKQFADNGPPVLNPEMIKSQISGKST